MLLKNIPFVCCVLVVSNLYFVLSGIQYWISDYIVVILRLSEADAHIYFASVSITAPILGAIVSGFVGSKIGGHESPYTIPICISASVVCNLCAVMVPMFDSIKIFLPLLWIMLFAGGLMFPMLIGVMISSVEQDYKAKANSLANLSYYLIGYFPAPIVYGGICSLTGGKKSRWGMIFLMYSCLPAIVLLSIV
jgi:MFS family permease